MKTLKIFWRVAMFFVALHFSGFVNAQSPMSVLLVSDDCASAPTHPISANGSGQSANNVTTGSTLQVGEDIACAPAGTNQSVWWKFVTPNAASLVPLIVNIVEFPPPTPTCNHSCCPITTVVWYSPTGGCPMSDPCNMVSCQSSINGPQTPPGGGGNPALTRRHRHELGLNELLPNTIYYVQVLYTAGGACNTSARFNYWVSNAATYTDITNPMAASSCTSPGATLCNIVTPTAPIPATIIGSCATTPGLPRDTVNTVIRECHVISTNDNTALSFSNYIESNCVGGNGNWDTVNNVAWGYWKLLDMNCNVISCGYLGSQNVVTLNNILCDTTYILCTQYEIENCTHFNHTLYTFGPNNSTCSPLPVELVKFEAKLSGDEVLLTWTTASEINNEKFVIERSKDCAEFNPILTVPGQGNSSVSYTYQMFDKSPFSGVNYYRLKQVDYDGNFNYSQIRAVFVGKDVGPVRVVNLFGQEIFSGNNLNRADLPSGLYIIFTESKSYKFIRL